MDQKILIFILLAPFLTINNASALLENIEDTNSKEDNQDNPDGWKIQLIYLSIALGMLFSFWFVCKVIREYGLNITTADIFSNVQITNEEPSQPGPSDTKPNVITNVMTPPELPPVYELIEKLGLDIKGINVNNSLSINGLLDRIVSVKADFYLIDEKMGLYTHYFETNNGIIYKITTSLRMMASPTTRDACALAIVKIISLREVPDELKLGFSIIKCN